MKHLEYVIRGICSPIEYTVDPKILGSNVIRKMCPFRVFGISRRVRWIGTDMTESTRHSYSIRAYQLLILVVSRVGVIPFGVPFCRRSGVEIRIGEKSQTDDARSISIVRTDRH